MKMLTKEIERKLEKHPFGSTEGKGFDAEVIVKYFNPYGRGTWLITEGEKQENGDWLLWGYCNIFEWEWGYVTLSEIVNTKVNVCGMAMPIERDLYSSGTVAELCY